MIDLALVARFEVLRAIRTWRAVALIVLFMISSAGSTYLFVRMVGAMENAMANQLGVPTTTRPGAMLDKLVESDTWREVVAAMVGREELLEFALQVPPLALFSLWFGLLLVPFFAASASAECIAIDVQSRAIRYEALRTGRLEIVLGRMVGQIVLNGAALALSLIVGWAVGIGFMVVDNPAEVGAWMGWFGVRAWAFSVPFIGLGIAASQLTSSPAWARVMALGATAGSWVLYGLVQVWREEGTWPLLTDVMLQLLPQGWLQGLWSPDQGWIVPALAVLGLGALFASLGFIRFARRDL